MLKRTGNGIVYAFGLNPNDKSILDRPSLHVKLANFDIDGVSLKDVHKKWINKFLIPGLNGRKANIRIDGFASSSGTDRYNKDLSMRRAAVVLHYLIKKGVPKSQFDRTRWHGEARASKKENQYDRAVSIKLVDACYPRRGPCGKPDRQPPPPKNRPDPSPPMPKNPPVRVTLREVYLRYSHSHHVFDGAVSPKIQWDHHPWELILEEKGDAPRVASRRPKLVKKNNGKTYWLTHWAQRMIGAKIVVYYKIVDYIYTPSAKDKPTLQFELPKTGEEVLRISSHKPKKDPPV